MAWFHREVLGDDSEQPWVRSRQTAEGLKALAFRFLGGVKPFDTPSSDAALRQAEGLRKEAAIAPHSVTAEQAKKGIPPAPLATLDYVKLRVDDQIDFYSKAIDRVRNANQRIVNTVLSYRQRWLFLAPWERWSPRTGATSGHLRWCGGHPGDCRERASAAPFSDRQLLHGFFDPADEILVNKLTMIVVGRR